MPETPPVFNEVAEKIDREKEFSEEEQERFKSYFLEHYGEVSFSTQDVRLDRISAENFRVLSQVDVDFDRQDTILYGQNSKGKTSLVKSLLYNIAGLPENPSAYDMTNLINSDSSNMSTKGYWTIDDSPYSLERTLRQSGQGSSLSGGDEPYLLEGHSKEPTISTEFTDPSDVLEKFGLQQLRLRGHDPYEILSLFFLMSEDFTRFLGEKHSDLLDLLFGINITTVVQAVEAEIGELELQDEEEKSAQKLREYQAERDNLEDEKTNLEQKKSQLTNNLSEKQERLESIEDALSGKNELDSLRQRKNELESRRADAKVKRSDVVEELGSVRRTIKRYEDTELLDDVEDIGEELQNFLTIPDRCPICTNRVDQEQRERLLEEHDCPLCAKKMPDDRYRTEVENLDSDKVSDTTSKKHTGELKELREKEQELEGQKTRLGQKISSIESEIDRVTKDIEDHDLAELADEQGGLRREVQDLRDSAVETEVKLGSVKERLGILEFEIKAQKHLKAKAKEKVARTDGLKRFNDILSEARDSQRQEIKRKIASQIQELFDYFEEGSLKNAHNVEFKSGGSYHFEIKTTDQILDSYIADESTAEINLHALLFHTAVLKLLSESINSPPLRLFIIDSPFDNEVDEQNAHDISNYLSHLPEILPEYQIVIASADTDTFNPTEYEDSFEMKEFEGLTA